MPRKPPPTIYTCISEPNEGGEVVIRYSADPRALDSLPTQDSPPPELVSKSRVAFRYVRGAWPCGGGHLRISCRGAFPWPDGGPGDRILGGLRGAMQWLETGRLPVDDDEPVEAKNAVDPIDTYW